MDTKEKLKLKEIWYKKNNKNHKIMKKQKIKIKMKDFNQFLRQH